MGETQTAPPKGGGQKGTVNGVEIPLPPGAKKKGTVNGVEIPLPPGAKKKEQQTTTPPPDNSNQTTTPPPDNTRKQPQPLPTVQDINQPTNSQPQQVDVNAIKFGERPTGPVPVQTSPLVGSMGNFGKTEQKLKSDQTKLGQSILPEFLGGVSKEKQPTTQQQPGAYKNPLLEDLIDKNKKSFEKIKSVAPGVTEQEKKNQEYETGLQSIYGKTDKPFKPGISTLPEEQGGVAGMLNSLDQKPQEQIDAEAKNFDSKLNVLKSGNALEVNNFFTSEKSELNNQLLDITKKSNALKSTTDKWKEGSVYLDRESSEYKSVKQFDDEKASILLKQKKLSDLQDKWVYDNNNKFAGLSIYKTDPNDPESYNIVERTAITNALDFYAAQSDSSQSKYFEKQIAEGKLNDYDHFEILQTGVDINRNDLNKRLTELAPIVEAKYKAIQSNLDSLTGLIQYAKESKNKELYEQYAGEYNGLINEINNSPEVHKYHNYTNNLKALDNFQDFIYSKYPEIKAQNKYQAAVDADYKSQSYFTPALWDNKLVSMFRYNAEALAWSGINNIVKPLVFTALGRIQGKEDYEIEGMIKTSFKTKDLDFTTPATDIITPEFYNEKGEFDFTAIVPSMVNMGMQSWLMYQGGLGIAAGGKKLGAAMVASTALQTSGSYFTAALEKGESINDALGYALIMGTLEGLSERIIPEERLFDPDKGIITQSLKLYNHVKNLTPNKMLQAKQFGFEFMKTMVMESVGEEIPMDIASNLVQKLQDYSNDDKTWNPDTYTWTDAFRTTVNTMAGMGWTSYRGANHTVKSAVKVSRFTVGTQPSKYLSKVDEMIDRGDIDEHTGQGYKDIINTMGNIVKTLPKSRKNGTDLSEEEQIALSNTIFDNKVLRKAFENAPPETQPFIKGQIDNNQTAVNDILNSDVVTTPLANPNNRNEQVMQINGQINGILSKPDGTLTPQDYLKIEQLQGELKDIQHSVTKEVDEVTVDDDAKIKDIRERKKGLIDKLKTIKNSTEVVDQAGKIAEVGSQISAINKELSSALKERQKKVTEIFNKKFEETSSGKSEDIQVEEEATQEVPPAPEEEAPPAPEEIPPTPDAPPAPESAPAPEVVAAPEEEKTPGRFTKEEIEVLGKEDPATKSDYDFAVSQGMDDLAIEIVNDWRKQQEEKNKPKEEAPPENSPPKAEHKNKQGETIKVGHEVFDRETGESLGTIETMGTGLGRFAGVHVVNTSEKGMFDSDNVTHQKPEPVVENQEDAPKPADDIDKAFDDLEKEIGGGEKDENTVIRKGTHHQQEIKAYDMTNMVDRLRVSKKDENYQPTVGDIQRWFMLGQDAATETLKAWNDFNGVVGDEEINKINEISGKGIETLKVKKNEPNNIVLKDKYKNSTDAEFEHGFTFIGELDGKENVDQSKPFAVGYFGDNSANRYEHATASNDISDVVRKMKDWDSNEGVVEIYNPKTKEKNSFTIYPEANEYTNESVGLKAVEQSLPTQAEAKKEVVGSGVEAKRIETEAKIKRKDLFEGVGQFSTELGGSDKAAVPVSHKEINGIEFVEYAHPETGSVDVIVAGKSDNDFVGFYRIYENGKPTNKWSSKFENQSRKKEDFKTMIGGVQEMLPQGHEYIEKTSISTDGLRVWNQQLSRGYELQYDKNGKLITNLVAINGDAISNELGIPVEKGEFENIKVKSEEEFEIVKKALLPYLEKLGLGENDVRWLTGTVKINLPVLKSTKAVEQPLPTQERKEELTFTTVNNSVVSGKLLPEFKKVDLYVVNDGLMSWTVYELATGIRVEVGESEQEAIDKTTEAIKKSGGEEVIADKLYNKIELSLYGKGLSKKNESPSFEKWKEDKQLKEDSLPYSHSPEIRERILAAAKKLSDAGISSDIAKFASARGEGKGIQSIEYLEGKVENDIAEKQAIEDIYDFLNSQDGGDRALEEPVPSWQLEQLLRTASSLMDPSKEGEYVAPPRTLVAKKTQLTKLENLKDKKKKQVELKNSLYKENELAEIDSWYEKKKATILERYKDVGENVAESMAKPIAIDLLKIERAFNNQGYSISIDYDNETQILDKKGNIVESESLPDNLNELAKTFSTYASNIEEMVGNPMAFVEKFRKEFDGEEAKFEEVKPNELPASKEGFKEASGSQKVYEVPLEEINTRTEDFQNRKSEFSQETVDKMVADYNEVDMKPITLWEDPSDKKLYVLSGHSRLQAFTIMSETNDRFKTIPANIFTGTLEEAKEAADRSNYNATAEKPYETAGLIRKYRVSNNKKAMKSLRVQLGKAFADVNSYSYLNPGGRIIRLWAQQVDGGDFDRVATTTRIAKYIGEARRNLPQLTNAHEDELFDFLISNQKAFNTFTTVNSFVEAITMRVNRTTFNPEEPLNLKNESLINYAEAQHAEQKAELKKVIADLRARAKNVKEELRKKGATLLQIKNAIEAINDELLVKEDELSRLENFEASGGLAKQSGGIIELFPNIQDKIEKDEIEPKVIEKWNGGNEQQVEEDEPVIEALEIEGENAEGNQDEQGAEIIIGKIDEIINNPDAEHPIDKVNVPPSKNLDVKKDDELDGAWDDLGDILGEKPESYGLDDVISDAGEQYGSDELSPEAINGAKKLIKLYFSKGIIKFPDIIHDAYNRLGKDKTQKYLSALKQVYLSLGGDSSISDDVLDKMNSMRDVRAFDLDKMIQALVHEEKEVSFKVTMKNEIRSGNPHNIISLQKLAEPFGIFNRNDIQEQVELAAVELSREIALHPDLTNEQKFTRIVQIYNNTPSLLQRDSTKVLLGQFSTPGPMGFLGGMFINNGTGKQKIFEPSAGNGMLTIDFPPKNVDVNEIDETRAANLKSQGFNSVTEKDATASFGNTEQYDGVITNPPFGKIPTGSVEVDGYIIKRKDHFMAINALKEMKSSGSAVLIIGGHNEFDVNGNIVGGDAPFFHWLSYYYNVVDVINVDGALYNAMGTTTPTRMIFVKGRKSEPNGFFPAKNEEKERPMTDWNQFFNRVNTDKNEQPKDILQPPNNDRGTGPIVGGTGAGGIQPKDTGKPGVSKGEGKGAVGGNNDGAPGANAGNAGNGSGTSGTTNSGEQPNGNVGGDSSGGSVQPKGAGIVDQQPEEKQGNDGDGIVEGNANGDLQQPNTTGENGSSDSLEESEKVPYIPKSKGFFNDAVIPRSMSKDLNNALNKLESEVGDIDTFVKEKLNYSSIEEMHTKFFAEQIDAIALAINNMEKGKGMIIGDMTGVGKGRIAAGIIRYAVEQGGTPVFVTKQANLFTDIYRDLDGIGSGHLIPFILNNTGGDKDPNVYTTNADGDPVLKYSVPSKEVKDRAYATRKIPQGFNIVLATYSQVQNPGSGHKRDLLLQAISGQVLVLDESHSAAGEGATNSFFNNAIEASSGTTFLSATFAKRPDNMAVYYSKTSMGETSLTPEELELAFTRGGVALQEIVAMDLVSLGEMVRRERNQEGVVNIRKVLEDQKEQHTKQADNVTGFIHDIVSFQTTFVTPFVKALNKKDPVTGAPIAVSPKDGSQTLGIKSSNFASKTHNLVGQMFLALKANDAANIALEQLKAGRKPVIAIMNTMETFLDDMGINIDDEVPDTSFKYIVEKALRSALRATETLPSGKKRTIDIPLEELPLASQLAYNNLLSAIKGMTTDLYVSPIDAIINKIEGEINPETGKHYVVGEVTGRKGQIKNESRPYEASDFKKQTVGPNVANGGYFIGPDGKEVGTSHEGTDEEKKLNLAKIYNEQYGNLNKAVLRARKERKVGKIFSSFNRGAIDVIILNRSGSTGASIHADKNFLDKRQRHMIILQPELDIAEEMQKRGRTDRANQVVRGMYTYLTTAIPSEKRLFMILEKKLKSLSANTTTNQKASVGSDEMEDFINKVGDRLIVQYLTENSEFNDLIGDPLGLDKKDVADVSPKGGSLINKVLNVVSLAKVEDQEGFYEDFEQMYKDEIDSLNQTNENDLFVSKLPLNAETKNTTTVTQGRGGTNPFAQDTNIETLEVDVLKKPLTSEELTEKIDKYLDGKTAKEKQEEEIELAKKYFNEKRTAEIQKITDEAQIKIDNTNENDDFTEEQKQFVINQEETSRDNKIDKITEHINVQESQVLRMLGYMYAGLVVMVPTTSKDPKNIQRVHGILTRIKIDHNKKNPYTPSNIKIYFAVNHSQREREVAASSATYNDIVANSFDIRDSKETQEAIRRQWDRLKRDRSDRKEAFMVTGNLLQGAGKYEGRFVVFSTKEGKWRKGILLPEDFEFSVGENSVMVHARELRDILEAAPKGSIVMSVDGGLKITKENSEKYKIQTPTARQTGGKYYLDNKLIQQTNEKNFESKSSRMVATVSGDNLGAFLFRLAELNTVFNVPREIHENKNDGASENITPYGVSQAKQKVLSQKVSDPTGETKEGGETIPFNSITAEQNKRSGITPDAKDMEGRISTPSLDGSSSVARVIGKTGYFSFTSRTNKISSIDDIAYIFRSLENEAVEQAFVVHTKEDGTFAVQHIGQGSVSATLVDKTSIAGFAKEFGSTQIAFVHNHPSGGLVPSPEDKKLQESLNKIGEAIGVSVKPGIIINLNTGHYSIFDATGQHIPYTKKVESDKDEIPSIVYNFSKRVFIEGFSPQRLRTGFDSIVDTVKYLSAFRHGVENKNGILVLDSRLNIVGNYLISTNDFTTDEGVKDILQTVSSLGGTSFIAYGNTSLNPLRYAAVKEKFPDAYGIKLLDYIKIESQSVTGKNLFISYGRGIIDELPPSGTAQELTEKERLQKEMAEIKSDIAKNLGEGRSLAAVRLPENEAKRLIRLHKLYLRFIKNVYGQAKIAGIESYTSLEFFLDKIKKEFKDGVTETIKPYIDKIIENAYDIAVGDKKDFANDEEIISSIQGDEDPESPENSINGYNAVPYAGSGPDIDLDSKVNNQLSTAGAQNGVPFKVSQRVKEILKKFNIPIDENYMFAKGALGVFSTRSKSIRVKVLFNVFVAAHEGMHGLSDKYGIRQSVKSNPNTNVINALKSIYQEYYPGAKDTHPTDLQIEEGMAVMVQEFLYDPNKITNDYPVLVQEFLNPGGLYYHSSISDLIDAMNELIGDYSALSDMNRLASRVVGGREAVRDSSSSYNFYQRLIYNFFNKAEALYRYAKKLKIKGSIKDPSVHYFTYLSRFDIISNWIHGEQKAVIVKSNGDFETFDISVKKYLDMVNGQEKEFNTYLVARRVVADDNKLTKLKNQLALIVMNAGPTPSPQDAALIGLLMERIAAVQAIINNDNLDLQTAINIVDEFENAFAEPTAIFDQINKHMIEFAFQANLISRSIADRFLNEKGYASFQRFVNDDLMTQSIGTISSDSTHQVKGFKTRSGSQKDIVYPVYSQLNHIRETIFKGLENKIWVNTALAAESNPEVNQRFYRVPTTVEILANGNKKFPQQNDPNLIMVWINGKRNFYHAAGEFLDVKENLHPSQQDIFNKILVTPSRVFTRLTTSANPLFAIGNFTVDQMSAMMQTKHKLVPVVDPAKGLVAYLQAWADLPGGNEKELMQAFLGAGGKRSLLSSSMKADQSPEEMIKDITDEKSGIKGAASVFMNILETPSNISEIITRFAEFSNAKERGLSDQEAMYAAANVTVPFQLQGYWGGKIGQTIVQSIPYFSATMNVTYKFLQNAKEQPARTATVASALIASSLGFAIAAMKFSCDDDKRYLANLDVRELTRALYIPKGCGKGFYRIRIPEQVGGLTALVYMYVMENYKHNEVGFDDIIESLTASVPSQFNVAEPTKAFLSWVPYAYQVPLMTMLNYKTYPDLGPIVPPYMQTRAGVQQYTGYTSEIAKSVANFAYTMSHGKINMSPMLLESWMRMQFGIFGQAAMLKFQANPLIRQEENYKMRGRAWNDFYEALGLAEKNYKMTDPGSAKTTDIYNVKEKQLILQNFYVAKIIADNLNQSYDLLKESKDLPEALREASYRMVQKFNENQDNPTVALPSVWEYQYQLGLYQTSLPYDKDSASEVQKSHALNFYKEMVASAVLREIPLDTEFFKSLEIPPAFAQIRGLMQVLYQALMQRKNFDVEKYKYRYDPMIIDLIHSFNKSAEDTTNTQ